jgi:murein L,D-transpeptidase YafK
MRRLACLLLVFVAGCSMRPVPPPSALAPRPAEARVDYILVDKSDRTLTVFSHELPLKTYSGLQLGGDPLGPKHFEGDRRTPEGLYTIDARNPRSAYHLSLRISYPNAADTTYAAAQGRSAGGDIFIHGQPNARQAGREAGDWTDGCIAVSNAEIEELWRLVPDGTPIQIKP